MQRCLICTDTAAIALDTDAMTENVAWVRPFRMWLNGYDLVLGVTLLTVAAGTLVYHLIHG